MAAYISAKGLEDPPEEASMVVRADWRGLIGGTFRRGKDISGVEFEVTLVFLAWWEWSRGCAVPSSLRGG